MHSSLGAITVEIEETHPPYVYTWNTGQKVPAISDLEAGDYTLKIKDAKGADTLLKFTIVEEQCKMGGEIFFTPNGDGVNDYWNVAYSSLYPNALIQVYNRLGQKVFEFSGLYTADDRWDGRDRFGTQLPTATYFFIVFPNKSDKKEVIKGTVSIIL